MLTVELAGQRYQLPQTWADVDAERLPRLLRLVWLTPEGGAMYLTLIREALAIRPKHWQKLMRSHFGPARTEKQRTANAAVLQQLVGALAWLWKEPIHEPPFPSLYVRKSGGGLGETWLLPEAGLLTMSWGELTDAYIHLTVFLEQTVPGDTHLDLLVATLCRPERRGNYAQAADWNGDRREPYNEYQAKARAAALSVVAYEERMAVLLYFSGALRKLMERYRVHGSESGPAEGYAGQGFMKNTYLLAEKGIFGNVEQTKATNAHEVLLFLEEHRADLLEQLERQKHEHQ